MINSRKIEDLDPDVRTVCLKHIALCHAAGIEMLITSTYRDYQEQDFLFAQGRTTPGPIVTQAKAGRSWHNFRCAYDAVPIVHGKADWDVQDPVFQQMIKLGRDAGAECGYDWPAWKDPDHFQVRPNAITIEVAKSRFDAHGTIFQA